MQVIIVDDYDAMSDKAAQMVTERLQEKPDMVLGLATGGTPEGLYARLVEAHRQEGLDFSRAGSFNLDEYVGLEPEHPQSYHHYMNQLLFDQVNIEPGNTHLPDGLAEDLAAECAQYEQDIARAGCIDLQVLGIGGDGHIGFNEPGTSLASRTHVAILTEQTIKDNARYFDRPEDVPRYALTMGVGTILEAASCLLMISGGHKAGVARDAIEGPVTAMVPASALQLHPDSVCILDEAAAGELAQGDFYRWQQAQREELAERL
ncbi:MAG: glucosamine-6-phosphate deaminase [Candidatus Brocadiia bacterium]